MLYVVYLPLYDIILYHIVPYCTITITLINLLYKLAKLVKTQFSCCFGTPPSNRISKAVQTQLPSSNRFFAPLWASLKSRRHWRSRRARHARRDAWDRWSAPKRNSRSGTCWRIMTEYVHVSIYIHIYTYIYIYVYYIFITIAYTNLLYLLSTQIISAYWHIEYILAYLSRRNVYCPHCCVKILFSPKRNNNL